jgi:diguanylate cyclase (GGDEF)-like protein/PAS domain S-box-containing protein
LTLGNLERAFEAQTWDLPIIAARSVVAGLYDAAVLMTPDLCVVEHNPAYAAMTGMRTRTLREKVEAGTRAFDLVQEAHGEDFAAVRTCLVERRSVHLAEREVQPAQGKKSIAWLSFLPVMDREGNIAAVIQILRDVTADARAQAKLKELLALMKARAEDLERAVERRTRELTAALEDVTRLSRTDPLTGLLNRRAFTDLANQALALAKRHDRCVAFLMCDLDFFKKVNDSHGHQVGDALLLATAESLANNVRESDAVARFGGEEFVVMLTETDRAAVPDIARRFNALIRKIPICDVIPAAARPQTISIGVAIYPEHGANLDQLLIAADAAMYAAKQSGRDRSVVYDRSLAATAEAPETGQKRVLVIDGDQRRLEQRILSLRGCYDVVGAPTPEFAAMLVAHSHFDVIVCEEFDGAVEVLRKTLRDAPGALRILVVETQDFFFALRATNSARVDHFLLRSEADTLAVVIEDGLARREAVREEMVAERTLVRSAHVAGARIVESVIAMRAIDFAFQPLMNADQQCFGYEALCRPQTLHSLGPAELFETAVRSGDIWRLGRLAREVIASRLPMLPAGATVFINLHPAEIEDPMLFSPDDSLRPFAHRIVFEITERASIIDFDHFRGKLAALKSFGYRFAVDDLGAGYASLSSVALLEPDFLKIDMSIIRNLEPNTPRYGLVKRIVEFANDQRLRVVAEGIETKDEAQSAREIGCHLMQGYLFGRPARIADPE